MYCRNCGAENPDDATFCQKCGADLKTTSATTGSSGTGSSSNNPSGTYMPPVSSQANPMPTSMNPMGAIRHAIDLVRKPAAVMSAGVNANQTVNSLLINYVAVLAAIDFIGTLIGDAVFYRDAGFAFLDAILYFIFGIIQVFVLGYILWKLAPNFGTNTTQIRAMTLAAYAYTPYFLISILKIIPILGVLVILGLLYGLYILYTGIPIMLGTPQDKVITYLIVAIVVTFIVYFVVSAIVGAVSLAAFGLSAGLAGL